MVTFSDDEAANQPVSQGTVFAGSNLPASSLKGDTKQSAQSDRSGAGGDEHHLTPSFATLHFDQSPGKASLTVRLQQPQVVAEVRSVVINQFPPKIGLFMDYRGR